MAWDSGLKIAPDYSIVIPASNLSLCGWLRKHTNGNEFSILNKCEWSGNVLNVLPGCVIPHQDVTASTVEFTDVAEVHDYRAQHFNVVTHCHPFKSASFSGVDDHHINTNFTCSILYSEGEFTTAVIPVQVHDGLVMHIKPTSITIDWGSVDIDTSSFDLSRIHTKAYATTYNTYCDNYGYYGSRKDIHGIKKMYGKGVVSNVMMNQSDMDRVTDARGLVNVRDIDGTQLKVPVELIDESYIYDVYANEFVLEETLCQSLCI